MATFTHIAPPAEPAPALAPLHLGKRLLAQRERLGLHIEDAALALQTDRHTITALESGDAIPPRLSSPIRAYLRHLEAKPTPVPGASHYVVIPPQAPDETVPDPRDDDPPHPSPATRPSPPVGLTDWDAGRLYTEIDTRRRALGLTWDETAAQIGIHRISLGKLPQASYIKKSTRAKLVAWLDQSPTDPTPSPSLEASTPASDATPTHPDIIAPTTPVDPVETTAEAPSPAEQAETSTSEDAQALEAAHRLFISHNIHLHLPDTDPALTALLAKLPDFHAIPSGYQGQWFRTFERLAELALTGDH